MKEALSTLLTAVCVLATPLFAAEIRYAYDERRQLTSVVRDGCDAFGYGYDLAGNLRWESIGSKTNVYETNCLNQYTTVTDGDGNVHHLAYDEDGNLIEDARFMYSWDSAGRLTEAIPSSLDGGVAILNRYDALGRRVQKEVYLLLPPRFPRTRTLSTVSYFYDGMKLVLERIETAGGQVYETEYFWGKDISGTLDGTCGVGGLLYVKVDGVPYVPIYDVGNVEAYCNTNGQVVASRTYSPYGQLVSGYGPPALYRRLHIWFASKYHDEETGLYYFGKRFYSPFLCRWLNQDPRGEIGGINLYAFCCNNPVNNFDPDGCAYFAKRGLGPFPAEIPWADVVRCPILGIPLDILADRFNVEIAHEQLFFEDGRDDPFSVGWSKDGYLKNEPPDRYVVYDRGYDDCIMREAWRRVKPDHYQMTPFGYKGKCNCQDYADALRRKYWELKKDPKVRCKCKRGTRK